MTNDNNSLMVTFQEDKTLNAKNEQDEQSRQCDSDLAPLVLTRKMKSIDF